MNLVLNPFAAFTTARLPGTSRQRASWIVPTPHPVHTVDKGAILVVLNPSGKTVTCVRGCLWITQDGDPKDVVIAAGDSYTLDRAGRMLVSALEDSSVMLAEA